jgi:hypothetical protein
VLKRGPEGAHRGRLACLTRRMDDKMLFIVDEGL